MISVASGCISVIELIQEHCIVRGIPLPKSSDSTGNLLGHRAIPHQRETPHLLPANINHPLPRPHECITSCMQIAQHIDHRLKWLSSGSHHILPSTNLTIYTPSRPRRPHIEEINRTEPKTLDKNLRQPLQSAVQQMTDRYKSRRN
jgi:hypothetical protein